MTEQSISDERQSTCLPLARHGSADMTKMSCAERVHLLEIFMNTVTQAEMRRNQVSTFYGTVLAASIALAGAMEEPDLRFWAVGIFILCFAWHQQLKHFLTNATAKWKVVMALEETLELAPFAMEHSLRKAPRTKYSWFFGTEKRHRPMTYWEQIVPVFTMLVSAAYLAITILPLVQMWKWD